MNLKGKRLLLQGASRGNLGLIKTAKSEGVHVIMTGLGGDFPCNSYADKFCYADISDPEAVLRVGMDNKVDGAIICCSDTGLQGVGRCNDQLHLKGITEKAALMSSNKYLMKEKLTNAGVRTARFSKVTHMEDLQNAVAEIGYPLIIKAVDLQGSRGIEIVRDIQDLEKSFSEVMALTRQPYCIVEQFIQGKEFGAQAFVYNGDVLFVLPHGDETFMGKTAVPVGHYMPYEMSSALLSDCQLQVRKAIEALGFDNCAVNVDFIEKDGLPYIIELTGRVGANCLPELTSNYFGINYYEMILQTALGGDPRPIFAVRKEPAATLARMVKSSQTGLVQSISLPNVADVDIHMFIHKGSQVRSFTNCNDAVGEVIVKGNTLEECEKKIGQIMDQIKIEVI